MCVRNLKCNTLFSTAPRKCLILAKLSEGFFHKNSTHNHQHSTADRQIVARSFLSRYKSLPEQQRYGGKKMEKKCWLFQSQFYTPRNAAAAAIAQFSQAHFEHTYKRISTFPSLTIPPKDMDDGIFYTIQLKILTCLEKNHPTSPTKFICCRKLKQRRAVSQINNKTVRRDVMRNV